MPIRVCVAGATGWAGSALARGIVEANDLELVAAVSQKQSGKSLGNVLGIPNLNVSLAPSVEQALTTRCDVMVEYTRPEVAFGNVRTAIEEGVNTVIGTSGLSDGELAELGRLATEHKVGVLAVGNFSLATVVLSKCAQIAARVLNKARWELIDYASAGKPDAPSGTARELAFKLGQIRQPPLAVPVAETQGPIEARGATLNGVQVHSVRLPGRVLGAQVVFGLPDEELSFFYQAGNSPDEYVEGALLAIRRVGSFVGLKRGLDTVVEF